ncbi:MAG: 5' nucleotidase, NT5C type [Bacillota bacterium]
MPKPVLLFDLDGVCCNLMKKWLAVYNQDYDDDLTEEEITSWNWDHFVKPECGKRIYHYLNRPGFFADLEPIEGCVEALDRLQHLCELVVVTASPKEAAGDKIAWVRRHLPMVPKGNIVITYRKDLVRGDFMFDDAPKNLIHHPATRILMDYPYNRDFHDGHRVHSWAEAEALIRLLVAARDRRTETPSAERAMQPVHPI